MTQIERARRRVGIARYVVGVSAAAALAGFAAMARVAHPGTAPNIGPSGSAQPQIQSGAS